MPSWGFDHEKSQVHAGANTVAGLKAGFQPYENANVLSSKRNVIATNKGWMRRTIKNNRQGGGTRIIDEPLVPANPGIADGYANTAHLGFADIAQIYMDSTSVSPGATNIYVVFNEPVKYEGGAGGQLRLTLTRTSFAGNASVGQALAVRSNSNTGIINANNTLKFAVTFVAGDAGTYKIQAASNTIVNATATAYGSTTTGPANLVSYNTLTSANLVVTGAVSNTLGTITVSAS
mgnify:CR=1 FL=1